MEPEPDNLRILVADDNPTVLEIFRLSFTGRHLSRLTSRNHISNASQAVNTSPSGVRYDVCFCRQAEEAVAAVERSVADKTPFSVAFLDIRMPPGNDGIWAAEQIRSLDAQVEFVMVTAYSDVHPREIARRVLPGHKLLYIRKPFGPVEIYQFASALGSKWRVENELRKSRMELENRVRERTVELVQANEQLVHEISDRKNIENTLRQREIDLKSKQAELEETNAALNVPLKNMEAERREFEKGVTGNVKHRVLPHLKKLHESHLNNRQAKLLDIVENALEEITSPFLRTLGVCHDGLTPTEIQVADLVREGKTSKA